MNSRLYNTTKFFDLKSFYQKLLHLSKTKIPTIIENRFQELFKDSKSVEWSKIGDDFEALFFQNNLEKIARFNLAGYLLEVRTNFAPSDFSASDNYPLKEKGKLMNYIQILRGDQLYYEMIIKKPDMKRILVLLNDRYEIIKEEIL